MTRRWRERFCGLLRGHEWVLGHKTELIPTRTCLLCGRMESRLPNFAYPDKQIWVLTTPYDSQPQD